VCCSPKGVLERAGSRGREEEFHEEAANRSPERWEAKRLEAVLKKQWGTPPPPPIKALPGPTGLSKGWIFGRKAVAGAPSGLQVLKNSETNMTHTSCRGLTVVVPLSIDRLT
jgi:hypothetical protein